MRLLIVMFTVYVGLILAGGGCSKEGDNYPNSHDIPSERRAF